MLIAVGSKNPAKIKAAKIVVKKLFPGAKVLAVDAPSKVSSQPKSDEEAIKGATNRAKYAKIQTNADYAIGMEGGVHKIGKKWFECGWIAIIDKNGKWGIGSSGRYEVSKKFLPRPNHALAPLGTRPRRVYDCVRPKHHR